MIGTWIVVLIALIILWLVFTFNTMVATRNRTQAAWSEIDVGLKRRHDLIPNLVNTAQGYGGTSEARLRPWPMLVPTRWRQAQPAFAIDRLAARAGQPTGSGYGRE